MDFDEPLKEPFKSLENYHENMSILMVRLEKMRHNENLQKQAVDTYRQAFLATMHHTSDTRSLERAAETAVSILLPEAYSLVRMASLLLDWLLKYSHEEAEGRTRLLVQEFHSMTCPECWSPSKKDGELHKRYPGTMLTCSNGRYKCLACRHKWDSPVYHKHLGEKRG